LVTPHTQAGFTPFSLSIYLLCGSFLDRKRNEGEPNLVLQEKRIAGAGAGVRAELVTIAAGHAQSRVQFSQLLLIGTYSKQLHFCLIKEGKKYELANS
jgi:hypothetical protein